MSSAKKQQASALQHFTNLPTPLLELILISGTSRKDKKALRQTCKPFQQLLDNKLVQTKLFFASDEGWPCCRGFLRQKHSMHGLFAIVSSSFHHMDGMFKHLPHTLTTLWLYVTSNINLTELARLPRLTSLRLEPPSSIHVTGLDNISGLTFLRCYNPMGSLANLAPTLKHLNMSDYNDVQDLNKLTNLEVLRMSRRVPANFFESHGHLPLKHMWLNLSWDNHLAQTSEAWQSAPTTLTRLTLQGYTVDISLQSLPTTITHLQLLCIGRATMKSAVSILTWLRKLDVSGYISMYYHVFSHLSNLTNLQSLGTCLQNAVPGVGFRREETLKFVPGIAAAVDRGVMLHVVTDPDELLGYLEGPIYSHSTWTTYA